MIHTVLVANPTSLLATRDPSCCTATPTNMKDDLAILALLSLLTVLRGYDDDGPEAQQMEAKQGVRGGHSMGRQLKSNDRAFIASSTIST